MHTQLEPTPTSPLVRLLKKKLWSDETTDCIICAGLALLPLFIGAGLALSGRWLAASIVLLVFAVFLVAAAGLLKGARWAATLAATLCFLTGSWLIAAHFSLRASRRD